MVINAYASASAICRKGGNDSPISSGACRFLGKRPGRGADGIALATEPTNRSFREWEALQIIMLPLGFGIPRGLDEF